jgi:predicted transcriptional regulator
MSARAAWRLASIGFKQVYRYRAGKADWQAYGLPVEGSETGELRAGDLASLDVPTCRLSDTIDQIKERLDGTGWEACVVVNAEQVVLGLIRVEDLEADAWLSAEEIMDPAPRTYRLNKSLGDVIRYMDKQNIGSVLVTNPEGKLFGLLTRDRSAQARTELEKESSGGR